MKSNGVAKGVILASETLSSNLLIGSTSKAYLGLPSLDLAVSECQWEIVWFLEDTYGEYWKFFLYFTTPTRVVTLIQQIPIEISTASGRAGH